MLALISPSYQNIVCVRTAVVVYGVSVTATVLPGGGGSGDAATAGGGVCSNIATTVG